MKSLSNRRCEENPHLIDSPPGLSPATACPSRKAEQRASGAGPTEASEEHLHLNGIRRTQHFPHHMPRIGRHPSLAAAATYL